MSRPPRIEVVEETPGTGLDNDTRCRWAAQNAATEGSDFRPTEAERLRIERGRQLLRQSIIKDLV